MAINCNKRFTFFIISLDWLYYENTFLKKKLSTVFPQLTFF